MFSQVCVILFTGVLPLGVYLQGVLHPGNLPWQGGFCLGGGGVLPPGGLHPWGSVSMGLCIQAGGLHPEGSALGGLHPGGVGQTPPPGSASGGLDKPPRTRRAVGTHPTGILSCSKVSSVSFLVLVISIYPKNQNELRSGAGVEILQTPR